MFHSLGSSSWFSCPFAVTWIRRSNSSPTICNIYMCRYGIHSGSSVSRSIFAYGEASCARGPKLSLGEDESRVPLRVRASPERGRLVHEGRRWHVSLDPAWEADRLLVGVTPVDQIFPVPSRIFKSSPFCVCLHRVRKLHAKFLQGVIVKKNHDKWLSACISLCMSLKKWMYHWNWNGAEK